MMRFAQTTVAVAVAAVVVMLCSVSAVNADVILDTGNAGIPSNLVIFKSSGNGQALGGSFDLTQSATITGLGAYIHNVTDAGSLDLVIFNATLYSQPSSNGYLPDPITAITSSVFGTVTLDVSDTGLHEVTGLSFDLDPGHYFIAAVPSTFRTGTADSGLVAYLDSAVTPLTTNAFYGASGYWSTAINGPSAFRIDGIFTPEPASLAMLGLGGLVMLSRKRGEERA